MVVLIRVVIDAFLRLLPLQVCRPDCWIANPGLQAINPVSGLWSVDPGFSLFPSLQVHEHLPIYASCIQEFQTRLDHLQIGQAKLAEVLSSDKRCPHSDLNWHPRFVMFNLGPPAPPPRS